MNKRMSDIDALLWRIESDPLLRSTVMMVSVLDQWPDIPRLVDRIDRGTIKIPRLRERVAQSRVVGTPRWEPDPHFDLKYHLRFLKAPGDGTLREVLDFAVPIAMAGFDRSRPLWETYLIDGVEGGRAVMIQKAHHSLTDGIGGIEMALSTLDIERDPEVELDPASLRPPGHVDASPVAQGLLERGARTTIRSLRAPRVAAGRAREVVASLQRFMGATPVPLSPIMTGRSTSARYDTLTIALKPLKTAAKSRGGTVNEAFISALMGGLRAYHEKHGADTDELRMTLPVSTREAGLTDAEGNNQFVPTRFVVPLTIEDPAERMVLVRERLAEQLAEPAMEFTESIGAMLNRLPTPITASILGSMYKGIDFIASNVPGPPVPLYIAGAQIEAQYPFGPLAAAAVNFTLLSGADRVCIGVNTDPAAVPDPEVLLECIQRGFDELLT